MGQGRGSSGGIGALRRDMATKFGRACGETNGITDAAMRSLIFGSRKWDHPLMKVKANDKKRVILPAKPAEPKLVKARKVNGRWMGAKEARPDHHAIVVAIRADREAR